MRRKEFLVGPESWNNHVADNEQGPAVSEHLDRNVQRAPRAPREARVLLRHVFQGRIFHLHLTSNILQTASVCKCRSLLEGLKPINELLICEFDREMSNTQKTLERVPADKWNWKPQEKSGSLGWMAAHVATLPGFTTATIRTPELDVANAHIPKVEKQAEDR